MNADTPDDRTDEPTTGPDEAVGRAVERAGRGGVGYELGHATADVPGGASDTAQHAHRDDGGDDRSTPRERSTLDEWGRIRAG